MKKLRNDISKKEIMNLAKKKDKDIIEREILCDNCAWAYRDDECVVDGECEGPQLTGFKPNWIWRLIETSTKTNIIDINGNTKEIEYSIFNLKKIKEENGETMCFSCYKESKHRRKHLKGVDNK